MINLLYFIKKLKFFNQHYQKDLYNIIKEFKIFEY